MFQTVSEQIESVRKRSLQLREELDWTIARQQDYQQIKKNVTNGWFSMVNQSLCQDFASSASCTQGFSLESPSHLSNSSSPTTTPVSSPVSFNPNSNSSSPFLSPTLSSPPPIISPPFSSFPCTARRHSLSNSASIEKKQKLESLKEEEIKGGWSAQPSQIIKTISGQAKPDLVYVWGVAYHTKNEHLIVSDERNNRVAIYSLKGPQGNSSSPDVVNVLTKGNTNFSYTCGICQQPGTNNVLIADTYQSRIRIFNENYEFLCNFSDEKRNSECFIEQPLALACNGKGDILVTEFYIRKSVRMLDPRGRLLRIIATCGADAEQVLNPSGICFDHLRNRILVADCRGELKVYSGDGSQFLFSIPFEVPPISVSMDAYGHIVLGCGIVKQDDYATCGNQMLQVLDGTSLKCIKEYGKLGVEPGDFRSPSSICFDNENNMYVAEYNNNRVQRFDWNAH